MLALGEAWPALVVGVVSRSVAEGRSGRSGAVGESKFGGDSSARSKSQLTQIWLLIEPAEYATTVWPT